MRDRPRCNLAALMSEMFSCQWCQTTIDPSTGGLEWVPRLFDVGGAIRSGAAYAMHRSHGGPSEVSELLRTLDLSTSTSSSTG